MNRPTMRQLGLLLLVFPLAGLMLLAAQAGYASLYYFQATFALERWPQQQPDLPDYQKALAAITTASRLQPGNPHYLLVQAKIIEWGWHSGHVPTHQLAANEDLYQQAIRLRPDWPVAYADYGYFLGHTQFRLTDAWEQLRLARSHGAFLPQVQQKFLSFSYQYWRYLSASQKAEIFAYLQQTLFGHLQNQTIDLIRQFKMQRLSCIYLSRRAAAEPDWVRLRPQLCGGAVTAQ